jgi:hypothetical protein
MIAWLALFLSKPTHTETLFFSNRARQRDRVVNIHICEHEGYLKDWLFIGGVMKLPKVQSLDLWCSHCFNNNTAWWWGVLLKSAVTKTYTLGDKQYIQTKLSRLLFCQEPSVTKQIGNYYLWVCYSTPYLSRRVWSSFCLFIFSVGIEFVRTLFDTWNAEHERHFHRFEYYSRSTFLYLL